MSAPLAATQEWQTVMDRAGHQCQCTRAGHPGHRVAGRCLTQDEEAGARLIAAPANPGPYPARAMARPPTS